MILSLYKIEGIQFFVSFNYNNFNFIKINEKISKNI